MNFFKNAVGAAVGAVKKVKTVAVALFVGTVALTGTEVFAEAVANNSPVQRASDGTITFTPQNVMSPIIEGAIAAWTSWAGYAIIGIVLLIMFMIFRRK